jgi:hypothetical protein
MSQPWRKLHPKVQLFQRKEGGMLYWPACWVTYKKKFLENLDFSLQPAIDTTTPLVDTT